MPKLTPIIATTSAQSGVQFGRASEAAMGAGEAQGLQSIGTAVSGLGQVLKKREDDAEVSRVNRQLAEAHAAMTVDWNERYQKADPNDKELAQRFNEEWAQKLDELGQGIDSNVARRHFDGASAKMKADFYAHSMVGQAQLGGIREREDFEAANGARKTSVYNAPYTLNDKLAEYDADMERRITNGQLRRDQAEQMRNRDRLDMTMNAFSGMLKVDPQGAKQALDSGQYDHLLTGDAKKHAYAEVKAKEHELITDENNKRILMERAKKAAQELTQQDLLSELVSGRLSVSKIMNSNLDAIGGGSKKAFLDMLDAENRGESVKTDMATWAKLNAMQSTPELQAAFMNEDITGKYAKTLSPGDMKSFLKAQADLRAGGTDETARSERAFKIAEDELKASGIKPNDTQKGQLHGAMREEMNIFVKNHKRQPTEVEIKEMSARVLADQAVPWYRWSKKVYEDYKPGGQPRDITVSDIPAPAKEAIKSALMKNKKDASDANVLRLWKYQQDLSNKAGK